MILWWEISLYIYICILSSQEGIDLFRRSLQTYNPNTMSKICLNISIFADSTLTSFSLFNILHSEVPSCYYASCGYDERVYLNIFNSEPRCEHDEQKKKITDKLGYVVCPSAKVVCKF